MRGPTRPFYRRTGPEACRSGELRCRRQRQRTEGPGLLGTRRCMAEECHQALVLGHGSESGSGSVSGSYGMSERRHE